MVKKTYFMFMAHGKRKIGLFILQKNKKL